MHPSLNFALLGTFVFGTSALLADTRSIDGTGNNMANPDWGAAGTMFIRDTGTTYYDDGMNAPRMTGMPNARDVSNAVSVQTGSMPSNRQLSDFVWQWGQFIDHDITLAKTGNEFLPVMVTGANDPLNGMIPMMRTEYMDGVVNPREQVNSITSFLDGSMVYGSDMGRATALRTGVDGLLKTSGGGMMLPLNTMGLENANESPNADTSLYAAGDIRANEQPGLTAMHTLFVREHNRLAGELKTLNPGLTDDQLYDHARRTVGAQIQVITYNEFLPALLGNHAPDVASYSYSETINPSISNEFAGALYRLGHSMVSETLIKVQNDGSPAPGGGSISLMEAFFNPSMVATNDDVDHILKGLATQAQQEVDTRIVEDLRSALFGLPGSGGLDLAALNIQRGRDHGLPHYNEMRLAMGLDARTSFDQITMDLDIRTALESLYTSVDDIDLWVGALAEDHVSGASVGELLATALANQFTNLRDGDRFFFIGDGDFTQAEIDEIMNTQLSDIILRNTSLTDLQDNVFFVIPEPGVGILLACASLLALRRRRVRSSP